MRRVRKIEGIEKIIHIGLHGNLNTGPGLRDSIEEGNTVITLEDIRKKGISGIRRYFSEGKPSFISFDVDFLDPSIAPAVGVPEPDGSSYRMAIYIIDEIIKNTNIVGMDFTEYNPALESNILTGIHVTNLIMESMACVSKNSGKLIK